MLGCFYFLLNPLASTWYQSPLLIVSSPPLFFKPSGRTSLHSIRHSAQAALCGGQRGAPSGVEWRTEQRRVQSDYCREAVPERSAERSCAPFGDLTPPYKKIPTVLPPAICTLGCGRALYLCLPRPFFPFFIMEFASLLEHSNVFLPTSGETIPSTPSIPHTSNGLSGANSIHGSSSSDLGSWNYPLPRIPLEYRFTGLNLLQWK